MDCDMDEDGCTTVGQLKLKLIEFDIKFPPVINNFFINILLEQDIFDPNCAQPFIWQGRQTPIASDEDYLSFKKL